MPSTSYCSRSTTHQSRFFNRSLGRFGGEVKDICRATLSLSTKAAFLFVLLLIALGPGISKVEATDNWFACSSWSSGAPYWYAGDTNCWIISGSVPAMASISNNPKLYFYDSNPPQYAYHSQTFSLCWNCWQNGATGTVPYWQIATLWQVRNNFQVVAPEGFSGSHSGTTYHTFYTYP
jgi:hypothetical protein